MNLILARQHVYRKEVRLTRFLSVQICKPTLSVFAGRAVITAVLLLTIGSCTAKSEAEDLTPVIPTAANTTVVARDTPINSPTVEVTPVIPSPVPSATPRATPTIAPQLVPTLTMSEQLPVFATENVEIGSCTLTGSLDTGGSVKGTAPAPTPTAIPTRDDRNSDAVLTDVIEFSQSTLPIMNSIEEYQSAFQRNWTFANTSDRQAAQLQVLGSRISQLCSSFNIIPIPPEIFTASFNLADSLRATHAWVLVALDKLACCGDAHNTSIAMGYKSTFEHLTHVNNDMRIQLFRIIKDTDISSTRTAVNEIFRTSIQINQDAILIQNSVFLLTGWLDVSDVLDPNSLGPEYWGHGEALSIKRIRNRSDLNVHNAVVQYEVLFDKYGSFSDSREVLISGQSAIELKYNLVEEIWQPSVIVFVFDGFTYFIESFCRPEQIENCEAIQAAINSISVAE